MYKKKITLKESPENFNLKVKKDAGRFEVMEVIKKEESYFDIIPKLGDKFGPSYST
jgi:hypothetical protein